MQKVQGSVKSYPWGKQGHTSAVYSLYTSPHHAKTHPLDVEQPYAELWMGTHPSGPSHLIMPGGDIGEKLTLKKEQLGVKVAEMFNEKLPFLFKVLSIETALSIQAHPDKKLAAELHAKRPDLYADDNHKPEMAIALTPFEALISFRPLEEIRANLQHYPEFAECVGPEAAADFISCSENSTKAKEALKSLFSSLQQAPSASLSSSLSTLIARLQGKANRTALDDLLLKLSFQYPGDVGIYCALMLNYVTMKVGEALFLAANEPHAYISGDCIECMASSDNVVRSGLTPKHKDLPTLLSMLTYSYGPPTFLEATTFGTSKTTLLYTPPLKPHPEFNVLFTTLHNESEVINLGGPSMVLVTGGQGSFSADGKSVSVGRGSCFFVGEEVDFKMEHSSEDGESLVVWRAFCAI